MMFVLNSLISLVLVLVVCAICTYICCKAVAKNDCVKDEDLSK